MKQGTLSELKKLAKSSPTARAIFKSWANPERRRRGDEIELARFLKVLNGEAIERDFYETFKELERLGFGKLINGRHGKPLRFKLKGVFAKDIGQAVMRGKAITPETKVPEVTEVPLKAVTVRINEDGSITIPAGVSLTEVAKVLHNAVA